MCKRLNKEVERVLSIQMQSLSMFILSLPPLNFSVKKTHDSSPSMFTNAYCQQSFADVHVIIALATHVKEKDWSRMIWRETSFGFLFIFWWFGPSLHKLMWQLFWIRNYTYIYIYIWSNRKGVAWCQGSLFPGIATLATKDESSILRCNLQPQSTNDSTWFKHKHCCGIGIDWGQNARPQWRPSTKPALHNTRLHYDQTRSIRGWVCFRVACKLMTGLLLWWCICGCQSGQISICIMKPWYALMTLDQYNWIQLICS